MLINYIMGIITTVRCNMKTITYYIVVTVAYNIVRI